MGNFILVSVVAYIAALLLPTLPTWGGPGKARLGHAKGWLLLAVYVLVMSAYALAGTFCKAVFSFHEFYDELECKLFASATA